MSGQVRTDYHDLLNRLDEMAEAPYYALAKPHLRKAQEIILSLEKENKELKRLIWLVQEGGTL